MCNPNSRKSRSNCVSQLNRKQAQLETETAGEVGSRRGTQETEDASNSNGSFPCARKCAQRSFRASNGSSSGRTFFAQSFCREASSCGLSRESSTSTAGSQRRLIAFFVISTFYGVYGTTGGHHEEDTISLSASHFCACAGYHHSTFEEAIAIV